MLKKIISFFMEFFIDQARKNYCPAPKGKINFSSLFNILNKGIEGGQIHITDTKYNLCSRNDMKRFLSDNKINLRKYVKRTHDCENFSFSLMGRTSFMMPSFAIGIIFVETKRGNHALNFFIDHNKKFWYIEPQTDEIFQSNEYRPYFAIC